MGYWKSKVLLKLKSVFGNKKADAAAAAEACKSFDESKEEISKEFEDKKSLLQPKVIEIYEAASSEAKSMIKEPKEAGLKKGSTEVQKLLEELVKIEFPGSKQIFEASSRYGPALVAGPVFYIIEKVSTLVIVSDKETAEAQAQAAKELIVAEGEKKQVEAAADKTEVVESKAEEEEAAVAETE